MPKKESILKIKPVYECVYEHVSLVHTFYNFMINSFKVFIFCPTLFFCKLFVSKLILYLIDFIATTQKSLPREHEKNGELLTFVYRTLCAYVIY